MQCLVQCLHLRHQYHHVQISGIGSIIAHSGSRRVVNFNVSPTTHCDKVMGVEVVVHPKVTNAVPWNSVPFNNNWRHLSKLQLADSDFITPGNIDLIFGADVFSCTLHYG